MAIGEGYQGIYHRTFTTVHSSNTLSTSQKQRVRLFSIKACMKLALALPTALLIQKNIPKIKASKEGWRILSASKEESPC
jgi:hypothetical protein